MTTPIEVIDEKQTEQIQRGLIGLSLGKFGSSGTVEKFRQTPGVSHVLSFYDKILERRALQGLSTPVKMEDYSKEIEKDVLPTYYMTQGLRADINQNYGLKPMFNVMHSFFVGGREGPYNFSALWGTDDHFLRGSVDTDLTVSAAGATRVSKNIISRFQAHASDRAFQLVGETDIVTPDSIITLRTLGPSISGNKFVGSFGFLYSQSITRKLSLGLSSTWTRHSPDYGAETSFDLGGRYDSDSSITSVTIAPQGTINLGYVQKFNERLTGGVFTSLDLSGLSNMAAIMSGEPPRPSGSTLIGLKSDFPDGSVIRAQVDLSGKLAFALDRILMPMLRFSLSSELDHAKGTAKIGLGVQIESQSKEVEAIGIKLQTMEREEARKFMAEPPQ